MTFALAALKLAAPAVSGVVGNIAAKIGGSTGTASKAPPSSAQGLAQRLANLPPDQAAKITKTSEDFETMFLENTLERMFSSAGEEGPLGENGTGGATWRSMLTNEYAKNITQSGGVGIAKSVMSEMIRIQEASGGGIK
jgi:peptidoglycan hydrolase FlgJ